MKKILFIGLGAILTVSSCKNQDWEFPDYDYKTVYFADQFPVRTITFGEDLLYDNSSDNQGKFQIMATMGGVYGNNKDVIIDIEVDNNLVNNLAYGSEVNAGADRDVLTMPSNYYTLASNKIVIPSGRTIGGVEVQLTDAYFADPLSRSVNYVIPIKMTHVVGADSILSGLRGTGITNPNPVIVEDWEVNKAPKNFTLYAVRYINTWTGNYLRRGKDEITGKNGNTDLNRIQIRRSNDIETDELKALITEDRKTTQLPLTFQGLGGVNVQANLLLTFDDDDNCTVSAANGTFTASGTGKFTKKGEKNSFGNIDRDVLHLDYNINLADMNIASKDTLVLRDRGVTKISFDPKLK